MIMASISMSKHCFFLTTYDAYILYHAHFSGLFSCIQVMENLNLNPPSGG